LSPILAIVTNIDREHLDHYKDIEEIRSAFVEFVNKVPFMGRLSSAWTTTTYSRFCRA
jgi:UDP-N-acetylmuramate--alanine ligase